MANALTILLAVAAFAAVGPGLAGAALAQDSGPHASPVRDDPEKLALARQMMELSGGKEAADAQLKSMFILLRTSLSKYLPQDQANAAGALYGELEQEMSGLMPQVIDISVRAYAENYTTQELKDLVAFKSSPSGRSIALKAPAVREQAMAQTLPLMMAAMPQIMRRTIDRACEQSQCTPAQRQVLETAMAKAFQRPGA